MNDEPDFDSDRNKHLSEGELRILEMRRNGEDVIDRQGRPRVMLGSGPQSQIVIGSEPVRLRRAKPITEFMGEPEVRRLYEAVATANLHGWVLNTFITISWEVVGMKHDGHIRWCHDRLLERMRTWFFDSQERHRDLDVPYAAIWVREVGKNLGLHTHVLAHVPPELSMHFRRWCRNAAHAIAETARPDWRYGQDKPKLHLVHIGPNFARDTEQQWRIFRYLTKGIDPEAIHRFLDERHWRLLSSEFAQLKPRPQGRITGPRSGNSRDIGPSARRKLEAVTGYVRMWPTHTYDGQELEYGGHYLHVGGLLRTV